MARADYAAPYGDEKFLGWCFYKNRASRWQRTSPMGYSSHPLGSPPRIAYDVISPKLRHPIHLILSPGTRIVTRNDVNRIGGGQLIPAGAVAVITESPLDSHHAYKVRFNNGAEAMLRRTEISILKEFKADESIGRESVDSTSEFDSWKPFIIYRCVVGSQAFGLSDDQSDVDKRGIYLPPAELHWSLYGVPEQIENNDTQEAYWELQKFLVMALKANPNILECLHTPLVEHATPLAEELLANRKRFLSKLIYQTYNGYVMSQFRKLEQDLRAHGAIKWKHAMHLIRLLLSGIGALRAGELRVRLDEHRDALLAIKRGEQPWPELNAWRLQLHKEFDEAFVATNLPDRPDYKWANEFLLKARRTGVAVQAEEQNPVGKGSGRQRLPAGISRLVMKLLFPSHPLKPRLPDPDYAGEVAAAGAAGFECEFYNLELLREGDASGACRVLTPPNPEERSILHRGWMMSDTLYGDLHAELVHRGYLPVITPDQYAEAHYLPLAYEKITGLTPESEWIIGQSLKDAWNMYERFRSAPALIKDFVKSAKHKWSEACFIPANTSEARFSEIIHAFLQARGDQFNKGIVLRRFHELDARHHDSAGQPIHEEFRMFFWKGHFLAGTPAVHGDGPFEMMSTWSTVARRFQSGFISMDVARQVDGSWIIIEVGDGGVSGLPAAIDPTEFYRALSAKSEVP